MPPNVKSMFLPILLERLSSDFDFGKYEMDVFREMEPFIAQTKANIKGKLGHKKTKRVAAETADFSYSTLAPTLESLKSADTPKEAL